MKVICTNKKEAFKNLTLNKEYENVIEDGDAFVVSNDSGFRSKYAKKYFRVVPEAPPVRNLLDMLQLSFARATNELTIVLNRTTRSIGLDISASSISCGISEVDGISTIKTIVNEMYDNKVDTIVGERVDFFRAVIEYLLTQIREQHNVAFILMSDNNAISHSDEFDTVMNSLAINSFARVNPKSNNDITLWVINGR